MLRIVAAALVTLALAGCTATAASQRPAPGFHSWHYHDQRTTTWQPRPQWHGGPKAHHHNRPHATRPHQARPHKPRPHRTRPYQAQPYHGHYHQPPRYQPPRPASWR